MPLNIKKIKSLLAERGLKPLKSLGQNFLIEQKPIDNLLQAALLNKNDAVIEIGPGLGALTIPLAKQVKQVIAIEKDKGLVRTLGKILKQEEIKNVQIINHDALKFQISNVKCQIKSKCQISNYKIVSNLPYNIAAAAIMKFLEADDQPEIMAVMLQKEVAQRIMAKPPQMNKLAVFTQFYSSPKIISYVSKNNFYPKPKVDSAILQIIPSGQKSNKLFASIVSAGFSFPRKQLINNLSKNLGLTKLQTKEWLQKNKIRPQQRAETLTITDWTNLTKTIPKNAFAYNRQCV